MQLLLTAMQRPATERQVVERALKFAKPQATDQEKAAALVAVGYVANSAVTFDGEDAFKEHLASFWLSRSDVKSRLLDWWDETRQKRESFRAALQSIIEDRNKARKRLWPTIDETREKVLVVPRYSRRGHAFHLEHFYFPENEDAALGLALDLLLARDLGKKLRRCKLEECGAFFLGGPQQRKFCSKDHQAEHNSQDAARRMAEMREKRAQARRPK